MHGEEGRGGGIICWIAKKQFCTTKSAQCMHDRAGFVMMDGPKNWSGGVGDLQIELLL